MAFPNPLADLLASVRRSDALRKQRQQQQGGRMMGELGGGPQAMLPPGSLQMVGQGRARQARTFAQAPPMAQPPSMDLLQPRASAAGVPDMDALLEARRRKLGLAPPVMIQGPPPQVMPMGPPPPMMQQPAVAPLPVPPQQQPSNPMHGLYAGSENWDTAPGWLQRSRPAGPRAGTPNDQALADAMYGRNPAGAAPVQQPGMVEAAEQELLRRRLDERNAGIAAEMQANPDFGSWRPANEPPWHDAARAGQFPYDQGPAVTPHGAVVPRTRVGGSPGYQGAAPGVAPVGQTSMNPPSGIPVTDEELRRGPVRGASWQPVLPGAAQAMALGMAGVQAPILAAQEEARRRAEMLPEEMAASRERVGVGQTPAAKLTVEQEDAMRARHRRLRDERHARLYAPEDLRQMLLLSKRTGAPPEALAGARIAGALGSGAPLTPEQQAFALGQNAPSLARMAVAGQMLQNLPEGADPAAAMAALNEAFPQNVQAPEQPIVHSPTGLRRRIDPVDLPAFTEAQETANLREMEEIGLRSNVPREDIWRVYGPPKAGIMNPGAFFGNQPPPQVFPNQPRAGEPGEFDMTDNNPGLQKGLIIQASRGDERAKVYLQRAAAAGKQWAIEALRNL